MTNNSGLKADKALAARLFDELLSLSRDDPGVTRDAYGEGEEKAHRLMRQVSGELDLRTEVDAAGNLFLSFDGADSTLPPWIVGSHLDSVPHCGNYDGAAGVIGGLSALSAIKKAGVIPRRPIRVVIIRAEESTWFPESYIGSRAAFGLLPPSALDVRRADTGRTLREHMVELGLRPDLVATGTAALSAGFVHGFIELHIEQGPNLETEEIPIGLVTGIAGSFRYRNARCRGRTAILVRLRESTGKMQSLRFRTSSSLWTGSGPSSTRVASLPQLRSVSFRPIPRFTPSARCQARFHFAWTSGASTPCCWSASTSTCFRVCGRSSKTATFASTLGTAPEASRRC